MIHPTSTPLPEPTFRPPCRKKRRNVFTAAFTLVELLAVIAVMVMLLAFTLPIIRGGNNMSKSVWDIAGFIEAAQAYAMSQNTYVWVGFNAADAAPSEGVQLAAFAIASKDGTATYSDPANLALIDTVRGFENISLEALNATGFGANDGYAAPAVGAHVAVVPSLKNITLPTASLPTKSVSAVKKTLSNDKNSLIQISPSGGITCPGQGSPAWLNFQLQANRGTVKVPGETAIIEISTLTGRARILRPGDHHAVVVAEAE